MCAMLHEAKTLPLRARQKGGETDRGSGTLILRLAYERLVRNEGE